MKGRLVRVEIKNDHAGWYAYSPDLPGFRALDNTRDELIALVADMIVATFEADFGQDVIVHELEGADQGLVSFVAIPRCTASNRQVA